MQIVGGVRVLAGTFIVNRSALGKQETLPVIAENDLVQESI